MTDDIKEEINKWNAKFKEMQVTRLKQEKEARERMASRYKTTKKENDLSEKLEETVCLFPILLGKNGSNSMIYSQRRMEAVWRKDSPLCPRSRIANEELYFWIHHLSGWAYPNADIMDGRRTIRPSDVKEKTKANPHMCSVADSLLSAPIPINIPRAH